MRRRRRASELYQVDFVAALFGAFLLVWLSHPRSVSEELAEVTFIEMSMPAQAFLPAGALTPCTSERALVAAGPVGALPCKEDVVSFDARAKLVIGIYADFVDEDGNDVDMMFVGHMASGKDDRYRVLALSMAEKRPHAVKVSGRMESAFYVERCGVREAPLCESRIPAFDSPFPWPLRVDVYSNRWGKQCACVPEGGEAGLSQAACDSTC